MKASVNKTSWYDVFSESEEELFETTMGARRGNRFNKVKHSVTGTKKSKSSDLDFFIYCESNSISPRFSVYIIDVRRISLHRGALSASDLKASVNKTSWYDVFSESEEELFETTMGARRGNRFNKVKQKAVPPHPSFASQNPPSPQGEGFLTRLRVAGQVMLYHNLVPFLGVLITLI